MNQNKLIWITGVNTGIGKTFLASLAANCLQEMGVKFNILKPFCSGGMEDVEILGRAQKIDPANYSEINQMCFKASVTPALAAEMEGKQLDLETTVQWIQERRRGRRLTIIEGAGGLLAPLGFNWTLADLIEEMRGEVWIVARNQLGVLNHLFLTINELRRLGCGSEEVKDQHGRVGQSMKVWLFDSPEQGSDESIKTNADVFRRFEPRVMLESLFFLNPEHVDYQCLKKNIQKKIKKHLSDFQKSLS